MIGLRSVLVAFQNDIPNFAETWLLTRKLNKAETVGEKSIPGRSTITTDAGWYGAVLPRGR